MLPPHAGCGVPRGWTLNLGRQAPVSGNKSSAWKLLSRKKHSFGSIRERYYARAIGKRSDLRTIGKVPGRWDSHSSKLSSIESRHVGRCLGRVWYRRQVPLIWILLGHGRRWHCNLIRLCSLLTSLLILNHSLLAFLCWLVNGSRRIGGDALLILSQGSRRWLARMVRCGRRFASD